MPQEVFIRKLEVKDLPDVSAVHMAAFHNSALTLLGMEAVRRYYEWLLLGPHEVVALGAFTKAGVVGFCFGGRFHGALSGFLRKNRQFLIGRALTRPWLMANPIYRERLTSGIQALKRFRKPRLYAHYPADYEYKRRAQRKIVDSFGILAIAVHPRFRGLSVGKLLMNESEELARQQGYRKMRLTVHHDNYQALEFYEKLNWVRVSRNGVWNGRMVKTLGS